MAFIVKIPDPREGEEPWYMEWSAVSDSPRTHGMRLSEFTEYMRQEYGRKGMEDFPIRMERVEATGSSLAFGGYETDFVVRESGRQCDC